KEVLRGPRVELVETQRIGAGQQPEMAFVNLHHQRVAPAAHRAVAGRELREITVDFEAHGAAMAAATYRPHRGLRHAFAPPRLPRRPRRDFTMKPDRGPASRGGRGGVRAGAAGSSGRRT